MNTNNRNKKGRANFFLPILKAKSINFFILLFCLFVPVSTWRRKIRYGFSGALNRPRRLRRFSKIAKWQIEKIEGIKVAIGVLSNDATIRLAHIFDKDIAAVYVASEIFYEHEYHFAVPGKAVVIDIGMNYGFASLYFALRDDVDAVYAFEPAEFVYKKALFSFSLNKCAEKITAFNYGLGAGDKELLIPFNKTSSGTTTILSPLQTKSHTSDKNTITVQVKDAADEIRNIIAKHPEQKIVMKSDCEGAEKEIFERLDAENILPSIDSIVMEYHQNYDRVIEPILAKHDFAYFKNGTRNGVGIIRAVKKD